ncbi:MAG: large subunit ribosomal protein [Patescibacteria group bacterium]|nr:large subunit ribosomal protein [Patescibacteria group bacterium]
MKLTIQKRTETADAVRATGNIPAVFYGPKAESTPITVNGPEFIKVWRQAGESSVITLTGLGEDHDALIHDISKDPVKDTVTHVDFYVIEKGKKVQVAVPLEFIGEAPAVKTLSGVLIKVIHELEIEAMPKDLPHAIEVDISSLVDFDAQIKVSDIKLPAGVTAEIDGDEVVALVSAPKEETEEAPTTIDMSAIGISEERGKKEEEEIPAE